MRVYYCDDFVLPLPGGHRFPMEKYALLRERIEQVAPGYGATLVAPEAATDTELGRVHSDAYLKAVVAGSLTAAEVRRIGFPWSPELVERSRRSTGATIGAMRSALSDGVGANLAGGTHHAFPDHGEGFCVFNDVAVAIRAAQAEGRAQRFAIVDLDVHQGNGTAGVFAGDPAVYTASVHGASNYPFHKTPGDLDIGLPDGAGDEPFLEAVQTAVRACLESSQLELLFYIAGADAFAGDKLGRLAVSKEAMFERDLVVFKNAEQAGVPVVVVMAGGYATHVEDTVDIHAHSVVTGLASRVRRPGRISGVAG